VGLFGNRKKVELPQNEGQGGLGGLDIPPPPVPPTNVDPNSFGSFSMPAPPKPINQEEVAKSEREIGVEAEPSFPGLDKDWMNFAKGSMPSIEPALPRPEEGIKAPEIKLPEQKPMRPVTKIDLDVSGPIFMEMDTYSGFMGEIGKLHVKFHMMDSMLVKIDSLREKEDFELKRWHQSLDDMRRKLLYMDDALFESGR